MEGLVADTGYLVVSVALLGLVLVAVRLLPFVSTVVITVALLQFVLPNMALFESEGPKNLFVFIVMIVAILFGITADTCSIVKRLSHFWDMPKIPFTKD